MKEIEFEQSTPEELLRLIDAQIVAQRSHRTKASRNRATILAFGLLFIILAAGGALLVLNQMLLDLRQPDRASAMISARPVGNL
jgi:hypothetical protein